MLPKIEFSKETNEKVRAEIIAIAELVPQLAERMRNIVAIMLPEAVDLAATVTKWAYRVYLDKGAPYGETPEGFNKWVNSELDLVDVAINEGGENER